VALDTADLAAASDHRPVWVDFDLDQQPVPSAQTETGTPVPESVVEQAEAAGQQEP
jgi:hypothetical protein